MFNGSRSSGAGWRVSVRQAGGGQSEPQQGRLLPELPLDGRIDPPIRRQCPIAYIAMQAGIRPVSRPQHPPVLHGIEVDVVDVPGEVVLVLDLVFPEAALPELAFSLGAARFCLPAK